MKRRDAGKRRAGPASLASILNQQTRRWRIQHLQRLEIIRAKWRQAAGPYLASQVVPVRLVRKTLRLATSDSAWLQQMVFLKEQLLERLKELLPGPWVEDLKVVAGEPLPAPSQDAPAVDPLPLAPETEEMRRKTAEACAPIKDPALARLVGRAMLDWLRLDEARGRGIEKRKEEQGGNHEMP